MAKGVGLKPKQFAAKRFEIVVRIWESSDVFKGGIATERVSLAYAIRLPDRQINSYD
jgi:hypothetical protein